VTLPLIAVLLTTYNGELFLEEQLTSIFMQSNVDVKLYVWDDGSTDGTLEILRSWEQNGYPITIHSGSHIGSSAAFLKLLRKYGEHDYICFSDQDDVWVKNRLEIQISRISGEAPILTVGHRVLIDHNGALIGKKIKVPTGVNWSNSLVENLAPGNAQLFNRATARLVNSYPDMPILHYDHWIYLNVSIFGKVIFLSEELIRYRQHSSNQIGILGSRNLAGIRTSIQNSQQQLALILRSEVMASEHLNAPSIRVHLAISRSDSFYKRLYLSFFKSEVKRIRLFDSIMWKILVPFVTKKIK
jgi:glycosyltransferase involved in cell wall biosynthesis